MLGFFKKATTLSFIGGAAVMAAGQKFCKSATARKIAVNTMASGMKVRDDAKAAYESIKEDAQDICAEAKAKNAGE